MQELVDNTNSWCEELGIAPAGDAQVFFFLRLCEGTLKALISVKASAKSWLTSAYAAHVSISLVQGFISETYADVC